MPISSPSSLIMTTTAAFQESFDSMDASLGYYSGSSRTAITSSPFGLYPCASPLSGTDATASSEVSPMSGEKEARDKTQSRQSPTQPLKGKTAKDKRKLREKRRPTGVIRIPTESTGEEDCETPSPFETDREDRSNAATPSRDITSQPTASTPETPQIVVQCLNYPNDKRVSDADDEYEDTSCLTLPVEVAPVVPPIPAVTKSPVKHTDSAPVTNPRLSSLVSRFEGKTAQEPHRNSFGSRSSFSSRFIDDSSKPFVRSPHRHSFRSQLEQNNNNNLSCATPSQQTEQAQKDLAAAALLSSELREAKTKMAAMEKKNAELEALMKKIQTEAFTQQVALEQALQEKEQQLMLVADCNQRQEEELAGLHEELRILDKDLEELDEDNINLVKENQALHCALKKLAGSQ